MLQESKPNKNAQDMPLLFFQTSRLAKHKT
jgi:hypothetical protein